MANIFGILTAVLLALAAFVAYKNKDAYQAEVNHRKVEQDKLAVSQTRLKTAQTNLKSTEDQRDSTRAEVVKLRETEDGHKKVNADLKSQIAAKTTTRDANKAKLTEIQSKLQEIGNIDELVPKVKAIAAAIEDHKQQIAENESKLANLTNENTRTEAFIKKQRDESTMFASKQSYFKSATIRSIYPDYGFVTIGAGSTSGVVAGSTLEVVRDGQAVAKLLVSGVEANNSTASIIPDSLAQDTVLMVGDKVVPVAKPVEPPAVKPTAKPGAAPAPAPAKADDPFGEPAAPAAEPAAEPTAPAAPPAEKPAEESPF